MTAVTSAVSDVARCVHSRFSWSAQNCVMSCSPRPLPFRLQGTVTGLHPLLDALAEPRPGYFHPCCYHVALVRAPKPQEV